MNRTKKGGSDVDITIGGGAQKVLAKFGQCSAVAVSDDILLCIHPPIAKEMRRIPSILKNGLFGIYQKVYTETIKMIINEMSLMRDSVSEFPVERGRRSVLLEGYFHFDVINQWAL